eukprot:CAMPEP_0119434260 /NCGR_PEP_ID=MMETSP1335-20130426/50581_1 /TAXON_ID=259385 /ORGANISM="Chrysoculter rhomboideus, Strain RCC1486" /LENGTH=651 /DNA_ID=CAMNT_0007460115 /DNA_START=6 /DNA_END=1961 /DNA_ORIENTATION=+
MADSGASCRRALVAIALVAGRAGALARYDAVVIGAGPTGLAAALKLRNRGARVALVEKSRNPAAFDPERAFLYNVDGRGQSVLDSLGLLPTLIDSSVSQEAFKISIVKDDPDKPVSEPVALPTVDLEQRKRVPAQWIPRSKLVRIMDDAVASTTADSTSGLHPVDRLYGYELAGLELEEQAPASEGGAWRVRIARSHEAETDAEGAGSGAGSQELSAQLVLGTDGLSSAVRPRLAQLAGGGRRFSTKRRRCASAGLRYKVLNLPPGFALSRTTRETAVPEISYSVRSTPASPRPLKCGLLPLRTDADGRTANFITKHEHPLWDLRSAGQMREYLVKTFPHVPFEEVGDEELERFTRSAGGHFPAPQHCTDAALVPGGCDAAGAVLAGDALHAFPPDLGQGVNSGLQDVGVLDEKLEASGVRFGEGAALPSLRTPLEQYGRERAREGAALTRLVKLGYPFQYGQEARFSKLRQMAWALNVFLRLGLSKALRLVKLGYPFQVCAHRAGARPVPHTTSPRGWVGREGWGTPVQRALRSTCSARCVDHASLFASPRNPRALPRCAARLQYGQEARFSKLRQMAWALNVFLRLGLSKALPAVFSPQIFMLIQNPQLGYAEIERRADATTRTIWVCAAVMAAAVRLVLARVVPVVPT